MSSGLSRVAAISCRITCRSPSSSGRPKARVLQDVGDEAERDAVVALEHAGEVGRRLHAGRGIELAADLLDLLGDLLGAAPRACP